MQTSPHHLGLVSALLAVTPACGTSSGSDASGADTAETDEVAMASGSLTEAESRATLKLIDDICGDTWCEGDYDFRFRRLVCSELDASCTLRLQVLPREGVPSARREYWRSCRTDGFAGFDTLVATSPTGYQTLQPDYYAALTDCIGDIETQLR